MNLRKLLLVIFMLIIYSTAYSDVKSDTVVNLIKLVAIPSNEDYTGNDWNVLAKYFPKNKWKNINTKNIDFGRETDFKINESQVSVKALGARSMISSVKSDFSYPSDESIVRDSLKQIGNLAKITCQDQYNDSSTGEEFYEITLSGYKPVTAKVEWSYGSGGGSEYLILGEIKLPSYCKSESPKESSNTHLEIGELVGDIRTSDAGCYFIMHSQKGNPNPKQIASESYTGKGIIFNLNGKDVLIDGETDSGAFNGVYNEYRVTIPSGKTKNCGIECSETYTTINFIPNKGEGYKIPAIEYCIN